MFFSFMMFRSWWLEMICALVMAFKAHTYTGHKRELEKHQPNTK
jgi:hypothetical protein